MIAATSTPQRPPRLVAHAVDADVHRADEAHPVLRAWRSGRPGGGCRRRTRITTRATTVATAISERDPRVRSTSSSDGSSAKPTKREERERDEAAQSLDDHRRERDVAGAGGLRGPADAQDVATDGRRQHVAHELARPGSARAACAAARATSNTASTRCQRQAESTKPARVKSSPTARNSERAGVGVLAAGRRRPGSW